MENKVSVKQRSIRKKYFRLMSIFVLLLLGFILFIFAYINEFYSDIQTKETNIQNKIEIVSQLKEDVSNVLLRARGYIAFENEDELQAAFAELDQLEKDIERFNDFQLTQSEQLLSGELREFYNRFRFSLFPESIEFVKASNKQAIQDLFSSDRGGGFTKVTIQKLNDYAADQRQRINDIRNEFFYQAKMIATITIFAFTILLVFFAILIWSILKKFIQPVEQLQLATEQIATGRAVEFPVRKDNDELGMLITSFKEMTATLQTKEEELTMQNEELQAQQSELEASHEKLNNTISENKSILNVLDESAVMIIMDKQCSIQQLNDYGYQLLGYEKGTLINHPLQKLLFTPEKFTSSSIKSSLQSSYVWQEILQFKRNDGHIAWLKCTVSSYINNKSDEVNYLMIGIDITTTKQTQEELTELLEETEKNNYQLKMHNELNHQLTLSLDEQRITNSIHHYLMRTFHFDSSIFMLEHSGTYTENNIPKSQINSLLRHDKIINYQRLKVEKTYIIKRPAYSNEQGIATNELFSYDLYSAVFDENKEIIAVFCATRIGMPIEPEEIDLLHGVLKRVAVVIGRLLIYQEVQETKNLTQDILNNVDEGIQFIDNNGNMVQHNQTLFNDIVQHQSLHKNIATFQEWITYFADITDQNDLLKQFFVNSINCDSTVNKTMKYTIRATRTTNPKFINLYAAPVFDNENKKIGTVFVHRDITKEHEIDRMKSELVSTVSHELRTPLSSVLGFTELLLERSLKPDRQKKYLFTIHKEAKRLTNLINDFLDLQRMESGRQTYNIEDIFMNELIIQTIQQFKHHSLHNMYLVDEAANIKIKGDGERLIQVLTNLIGNAVKFSPNGGRVEIKLQNRGQELLISIKDEGIGIPEEQIENLFQKFKRVDTSETRKIGGTGLGLVIAKEIINYHNGTIWVESFDGNGSTFFFTLPLAEPIESKSEGKDLLFEQKTILIVEDDASTAYLLSEQMKEIGYHVVHHISSHNAYFDAVQISPVGIIVDLMLGEENGWDLIRKLKENRQTSSIPIIISSAMDRDDNKLKKYNVKDYLTKPYDYDKLTEAVLHYFQSNSKGQVLFPKKK